MGCNCGKRRSAQQTSANISQPEAQGHDEAEALEPVAVRSAREAVQQRRAAQAGR